MQTWLQREPEVHSTEVSIIERESVAARELVNEAKTMENVVNALSQSHETLQNYLSPIGANKVETECTDITATWRELQDNITSRSIQIDAALEALKNFYARWDDLERWLNKVNKKQDALREIYSDEVPATAEKQKVTFFAFYKLMALCNTVVSLMP